MDTQNPVPDPAAHGMTRYDTDPDALAWARTRVQHQIDRLAAFEARAAETGKAGLAAGLSMARRSTEQLLLGGEGCVVGAFDERRPQMFAGAAPTPAVTAAVGSDPTARPQAADDTPHNRTNGPIHGWFSLSYCNYAVLQRTLMQCMPIEWQERMVACLREFDTAFEGVAQAEGYEVHAATEHEIGDLDDEQRAALGITEDWYDAPEPTGLCEADLSEWQADHELPDAPVYRNADGEEVDGGDRVLLRCEDPIPHYRHAPYIEPRVAALRLDDPPATGGKTTPNPLRQLVDGVAAQLHDEDPATYHGDGGPADCKRCAATGGEQA